MNPLLCLLRQSRNRRETSCISKNTKNTADSLGDLQSSYKETAPLFLSDQYHLFGQSDKMKILILICLFISWAESFRKPPIHVVRNYIYDHMKVTEFPAMDYLAHKPDIRIGHKFRKLIGKLSRIVSRMLELQGKKILGR